MYGQWNDKLPDTSQLSSVQSSSLSADSQQDLQTNSIEERKAKALGLHRPKGNSETSTEIDDAKSQRKLTKNATRGVFKPPLDEFLSLTTEQLRRRQLGYRSDTSESDDDDDSSSHGATSPGQGFTLTGVGGHKKPGSTGEAGKRSGRRTVVGGGGVVRGLAGIGGDGVNGGNTSSLMVVQGPRLRATPPLLGPTQSSHSGRFQTGAQEGGEGNSPPPSDPGTRMSTSDVLMASQSRGHMSAVQSLLDYTRSLANSYSQVPGHSIKDNQISCDQFSNPDMVNNEVVADATELVASVLQSSMKHLNDEKVAREHTIQGMLKDMSIQGAPDTKTLDGNQLDEDIANVEWMSIEEFTVARALDRLKQYIKTAWQVEGAWLYCVEHHTSNDHHPYHEDHMFKVTFSMPTRRKPIPRATAQVYFTFRCSKIKPKDFPVEVFYQLEFNKLIHRPGRIRFQEKWLKNIIVNKNSILETINF